ncbi:hypothetical protein TELCIR_05242 [Teladorsagia circumcincta]|uniref:Uncharacterized protein n=1 Tax=Teladorsagia circumcincta TaxID=45464 RepID=A0A2G9UTG0_TELCI|nr:hypothetical protein TELCIR_05242 [Teladorsagia circumcincta]
MDIDLSKLPDETKVTEKKAPLRAAATAFTVNFDSADEEVSLQDAARKSAQARRILGRRSGGGSATSSGSQDSGQRAADLPQANPSNKRYLLNKLLQGEGQNTDEHPEGADVEERKECDVSSEAGTYVVDMSSRAGGGPASQLMTAKIIEDSDASDSDSSSSDSESDGSPIPRQKPAVLPPKSPTVKAAPIQPEASTGERSDLAKEMSKLRTMAGIRATASSAESRYEVTVADTPCEGANLAQQKEQEMNAWLRRKDYNPMKAAAEARKAKELKARGEQFVSNRSISFHVGPVAGRPAKVTDTRNNVKVMFCRSHCGHEMEPAVLSMDSDSEQYIVSPLREGFGPHRILKKIRAECLENDSRQTMLRTVT